MTTIKLGSSGPSVKLLQTRLGITADGVFGTATDKAVRNYQKEHGLTVDGIVGAHTWETLGVTSGVRLINEIIIHCSATKEGVPYTADQINVAHKARRFSAYKDSLGRTRYIGYHYIIHQNGTIEACRPESKIGCHASGHNSNSIGICYIGGLDARDNNGRMIKDTRTAQQKESLIKLLKQLISRYPTIKRIIGHRDTSPDLNGNGIIDPYEYIKGCPCFNAIPEYKDLL